MFNSIGMVNLAMVDNLTNIIIMKSDRDFRIIVLRF